LDDVNDARRESMGDHFYPAKELRARGFAVNTVAPGAIATDFNGRMVRDNLEMNRRVADMPALGHAGQRDDMAR
jgi:NAD(P)-dependent dehydrogenase (short-subunit alcohol dehydrogenase family)